MSPVNGSVMRTGLCGLLFGLLVTLVLAADANGSVHLATSCSKQVTDTFDKGVALLHSFWYEVAFDLFAQVSESDPQCAMAHWGMAMSIWDLLLPLSCVSLCSNHHSNRDLFRVLFGIKHPLWLSPNTAGMRTGAGAIARAREIVIARNASGAPVTPREIAYIESIAPYFIPANPNEPIDSRALKVGKNLQELFARFGNEDFETLPFYGLGVLAERAMRMKEHREAKSALWPNWAKERSAASLLEVGLEQRPGTSSDRLLPPPNLTSSSPDHPGLLHYLIHLYDTKELAPLGLVAASRYSQIAPDVPHALHMPSHIFNRLGMWRASVELNNRSVEASKKQYSNPRELDNSSQHSLDFLTFALLQLGEDDAMRAIVEDAENWKATPMDDLLWITARYYIEHQDWQKASEYVATPSHLYWDSLGFANVVVCLVRAYGDAHRKDVSAMTTTINTLIRAYDRWLNSTTYVRWPSSYHDEIRLFRVMAIALHDWVNGEPEKAIESMEKIIAEDITYQFEIPLVVPQDLLGELYASIGDHARALQVYTDGLADYPNRFRALQGAARAAVALSNVSAGVTHYSALLRLCDRPYLSQCPRQVEFQEAYDYLSSLAPRTPHIDTSGASWAITASIAIAALFVGVVIGCFASYRTLRRQLRRTNEHIL